MPAGITVRPNGALLRERREAAGLSLVELARRMHVTRVGLWNVERGEDTRPVTLQAIAYQLGERDWEVFVLPAEPEQEPAPQVPAAALLKVASQQKKAAPPAVAAA